MEQVLPLEHLVSLGLILSEDSKRIVIAILFIYTGVTVWITKTKQNKTGVQEAY